MKSLAFTVLALSLAAKTMAANPSQTSKGVPVPSELPRKGAVRSQGCWAGMGDTWKKTPQLDYPSSGSCTRYCSPLNYTVAALRGEDCYCGNDYPPKDTSTALSNCNFPCPGYDLEACKFCTIITSHCLYCLDGFAETDHVDGCRR